MKTLSLTTAVLLALSLTACGGNGNRTAGYAPTNNAATLIGGATTPSTNTNTTTTTTDTADTADVADTAGTTGTTTGGTTDTGTTTSPNTIRVAGNVIAIDSNKTAGVNQVTGTSAEMNKIVVGGQSIDFLPENFSGSHINQIDVQTGVGRLGYKLGQSSFGYVQETVDSTPYLFSQGNISASVPVANTAKYEGNAIYFNQGNQDKLKNPTGLVILGVNPQSEEEKVTFTANFTNKVVRGDLAGIVQLEGKIVDNGFSGELNGISTNGYFYGDNATELGGTYKNADGSVSGAYGATRTE